MKLTVVSCTVALVGALLWTATLMASRPFIPTPTTPPAAVDCGSVSCAGFVVYENGAYYTPCVNCGCVAPCSSGPSGSTELGGGWSACKCGGQVEPRCCHLIFRFDEENNDWEWFHAGDCNPTGSPCPAGECAWNVTWSEDETSFEVSAGCS